jgi:hypothetical protein
MRDRLDICTAEFARHLDELFQQAKQGEHMTYETPIIGGLHYRDPRYGQPPIMLVAAALVARERYSWVRPSWSPPLPLREEDCAALIKDDDPRLALVGHYATSLSGQSWRFDIHPSFERYARGLMDFAYTPAAIRDDVRLRQEFPPAELGGLMRWDLCWHDFDFWEARKRCIDLNPISTAEMGWSREPPG